MQRALYDKGSAQGKQPKKRTDEVKGYGEVAVMAVRYSKVAAATRALSNYLARRIMAYGL